MPPQKSKPMAPSKSKRTLLLPLALRRPRFLSGQIRGFNKVRTSFILLAAGYRLLAAEFWLLATGLLSLVPGCLSLARPAASSQQLRVCYDYLVLRVRSL